MDSSYAIRSFCSLFYLIFGVFPGPARPNLVFPRGHVPTPPFFFTVTFESYGLSWTWRSLPVPWLCYKYLSRPPKYMQGPCTNSLVFVRFLSVSSFHCHHSFIHSIIQKKWGSPLNFKPNSWDWSCKIILPTKRSTKKHLYPIESMYGIFAHIWLILMVNNWYIYRIPVPWILWGVNHHPQDITPENLRAFEVLRAFTRSGPSRGPQSGWKHRHQCAKERTGGGQNGLMGRNSRRSQHIDNIEYPPGNDRIFHLWKRKILFPATFQGDVLLPSRVTFYSVRLVIKPENWFFNTVQTLHDMKPIFNLQTRVFGPTLG